MSIQHGYACLRVFLLESKGYWQGMNKEEEETEETEEKEETMGCRFNPYYKYTTYNNELKKWNDPDNKTMNIEI